MNKELLKEYMAKYGEIQFIRDLAQVLLELGVDWKKGGYKNLGYTFANAAVSINKAANQLETAEKSYVKSQK